MPKCAFFPLFMFVWLALLRQLQTHGRSHSFEGRSAMRSYDLLKQSLWQSKELNGAASVTGLNLNSQQLLDSQKSRMREKKGNKQAQSKNNNKKNLLTSPQLVATMSEKESIREKDWNKKEWLQTQTYLDPILSLCSIGILSPLKCIHSSSGFGHVCMPTHREFRGQFVVFGSLLVRELH